MDEVLLRAGTISQAKRAISSNAKYLLGDGYMTQTDPPIVVLGHMLAVIRVLADIWVCCLCLLADLQRPWGPEQCCVSLSTHILYLCPVIANEFLLHSLVLRHTGTFYR